jgi:hypothetical protein
MKVRLDFFICAFGKFLAIETKATGKKLPRQALTIKTLRRAGAKCSSSSRRTQTPSRRC